MGAEELEEDVSSGGDGGDELIQADELIMSPKEGKKKLGIKIGLALATGRFEAPLLFDSRGICCPERSEHNRKPVLALTELKVSVTVSVTGSAKVNRLEP